MVCWQLKIPRTNVAWIYMLCLYRELHPLKHIWCYSEACYAHLEKVSLLLLTPWQLLSYKKHHWLWCFSRKVNSFLNKMNPSEVQMAAYIDMLREKQWPESQTTAPPPPPRTEEEKNQTKERAHELINARCRGGSLSHSQGIFSSYSWMFIP